MYKGKRILAVVPARGGSKGVPLKNIRELQGKPLIYWTGLVIQQAGQLIDQAVVSTDHEKIAEIAGQCGLQSPFRRPEHLSGDRIGDWDVLSHALQVMEEKDRQVYDIILMLQPTSPLRQAQHILSACQLLVDEGYDSVWSVSLTDLKFHPLKQLKVENQSLSFYLPEGERIVARQQMAPVFHRNGIVYAFTRNCLLEHKNITGKKSGALIIEEPYINIDDEKDFKRAEILMEQFFSH